MDQTFSIMDISEVEVRRNSFGSPVCNLTNLINISNVKDKKKSEFKSKLSKIRARTTKLLEKHNWRKYFNDEKLKSDEEINNENNNTSFQSFSNYNLSNSSVMTDDESSFLSTIDVMQLKKQKKQQLSKLNLFEVNSNSSMIKNKVPVTYSDNEPEEMIVFDDECDITKIDMKSMPTISNLTICSFQKNTMKLNIIATPLSTKRKMKPIESDNSEYKLNFPKKFKISATSTLKRNYDQTSTKINNNKLTRQQQSLTFIADFASTSTPNRKSQQPITSTPKISSHDPIKYHPTRTIRNKERKKIITKIINKNNKNTCSTEQLNLNLLKYRQNIQFVRPVVSNSKRHQCNCRSVAKQLEPLYQYQQQHHNYNFRAKRTTTTSNVKEVKLQKRRKLSAHSSSADSSFSSINSCDNCELCNLSKRLKKSTSKKLKSKSSSSNNKNRIENKISSTRISSINSNKKMNNVNKLKQPSTFELEISLQDLLYKPSKLRNLPNSVNSVAAVKSSNPIVTTTSNLVVPSKVYYL